MKDDPTRAKKQRPAAHIYLAVVLSIGLLSGCSNGPAPNFTPAVPSLRVLTYNVNWSGDNAEAIVDYLLASNADLICLQETHPKWERILKKRLSKQYPYCEFREGAGAGGVAFLSTHKLEDVRLLPPVNGWYPALLGTVHTGLGPVQVLNVHLTPAVTKKGEATIAAYRQSFEIHQKELDGFFAQTAQTEPLLVVGDFNEGEDEKSIGNLLEAGFTHALSGYDDDSHTWAYQVMPGITLKRRYDHILFSPHFQCAAAKVSTIDASDHRPVVAVLTRIQQEVAAADQK